MNDKSFLKLLQSVDAFFPIGAFTLSNGLEDYVMRNKIKSEEDLMIYLKNFIAVFPYNDLGLLSLAYRHADHKEQILHLDHIAGAMKSAREIRTGSVKMCSRYLKAREAIGDLSEGLAWYQKQGCRLLAHNFHTRMGELDVVVQEPDGTIVICEVKTRSSDAVSRPAAAVNAAKQKRLILAAQHYLQCTGQSDAPVRFDVAEVFPLDSGRWMVHIIRGAFLA